MISHIHGCIHKDNLFLCYEGNSEHSGLMGEIYFTFILYQIKRLSQNPRVWQLCYLSVTTSAGHTASGSGGREERGTGELHIDGLHCLSQVTISLLITFIKSKYSHEQPQLQGLWNCNPPAFPERE